MLAALPQALEGDLNLVNFDDLGKIAVYCRGGVHGRPLILVHSINAAPSAMEVKPLFEGFGHQRPVYAPDLPGFGLSPRVDRQYSTGFFTRIIAKLLQSVNDQHALAPDVVALSLSSEFVTRAIIEHGAPCHRLVLISPTGMSKRVPPGPKFGDRVNRITSAPLIGKSLFKLLTSRVSVRYFLNQAFTHSAPDELIDYALKTTKVPGAQHAPFAFLSMRLFSPGVLDSLYSALSTPTLVVYDTDPNIDFERLPELLARNPSVSAKRIAPTRGLPHWEMPDETLAALTAFFGDH